MIPEITSSEQAAIVGALRRDIKESKKFIREFLFFRGTYGNAVDADTIHWLRQAESAYKKLAVT